MHTKLLHKCMGCKRMVFTNSKELKGGQFEIGNMWSGMSPSYRNRQRYCCWEIRQPKHVLPVQWCHRLILWILWDIIQTQHFGIVGLVVGDKFVAWALWSPYLVPHDIFLRSPIYEERVKTYENLVSRILAECGTVQDTTEVCERVLQKMVRHCNSCSEVGGRHFEELVWISLTL